MRRYLPHILGVAIVAALSAAIVFASIESGAGVSPDGSVVADGDRVHGLTPEQAAEVAARVGEREITVGEVADELAHNSAFVRTRYNSPERRREFLDQMIRFELLAQEAERRGYHRLPEVQRAEKQMMIRRLIDQRFEASGPESISDADVRAYYDAHPADYHTPEQVRASHILLADRATAQRVLDQVRADESDLRLYRQVAEQFNTDVATRDRFGDLRFFSRPGEETPTDPEVPTPVREAAFAVERIGGVFPQVVTSPMGFHVVKLTGRRAARHTAFESADRAIRNRLWRERQEAAIEALVAELRAEADVEENLELLDQVHLELGDDRSPALEPLTPPPNPLLPPSPPGGAP